ncbi:MAG TPA: nitrate ABC transporter substrate-binding protein, partial [Ruminococcaceae bacterium]|nr:nitrate ABC transporter substrate-binding protein [Oscillospiraceae bacterium]
VWGEPFYKFPDMGDFSYSVFGTKKSTIEKDPQTVQKFTNAIVKALKTIQTNKTLAKKDLKLEFPTLSDQSLNDSLKRAYEDHLWSPDGFISQKAVENDMDVLIKTGIYTGSYTYNDLVNMRFVKKTQP